MAEVIHALQASEQRRLIRQEGTVEGALQAKHRSSGKGKKKKSKKDMAANGEATADNNSKHNKKGKFPPCQHCGGKSHPHFKCWRRPDAKCTKCHQTRHEAVICKEKAHQQAVEAQNANQEEEDQLFVATCFSCSNSSESWLIDSGCTNHMTYDKELFKELKSSEVKRVKIGNGEHISVKGQGTVAVTSYSGTKTLTDVLYVPEINQNLLSYLRKDSKLFLKTNAAQSRIQQAKICSRSK